MLEKNLHLIRYALNYIEEYFEKSGRTATENNRKQALVIEGSFVLQNDHGMAPGMVFTVEERTYMLLPGPPKEMEPMFTTYAKPLLMDKLQLQERIISKVLRFFGIGESQLETEIDDLIDAASKSDYRTTCLGWRSNLKNHSEASIR